MEHSLMSDINNKLAHSVRESIEVLMRSFKVDETITSKSAMAKMNQPDMHSLIYIARHPKCMASQLAEFLGVAPTTASAIIDRLVKKELITRSRTEENRRIIQLELSPSGRKAEKSITAEQLTNCAEMLQALSTKEQAIFTSLLQKVAQHIS